MRCVSILVFNYLLPCPSLRDNKLSGAIPESLGNLVNLEELWLNANQIEGERRRRPRFILFYFFTYAGYCMNAARTCLPCNANTCCALSRQGAL